MPQKRSALSLKELCMRYIGSKLELLCYGVERTDPLLATFLRRGYYEAIDLQNLNISSLPANLLTDLLKMTDHVRTLPHHVLHMLIQPGLISVKMPKNTNKRSFLNLLELRCSHLQYVDLAHTKVKHTLCTLSSQYRSDLACVKAEVSLVKCNLIQLERTSL